MSCLTLDDQIECILLNCIKDIYLHKLLCIIYKIVNVVYEKQLMKVQFSLARTYELR